MSLGKATESFAEALYYFDVHKYDKAIKCFDKAITLNPNCSDAYLYRAETFFELRRFQNAADNYEIGIALAKKYDDLEEHEDTYADFYFNLAYSYGELERDDEAISYYSKAIELEEYEPVYYNNRGLVFLGINKIDEAMADFDKALSLDAGYSSPYLNRGKTYAMQGNPKAGYAAIKMALEVEPLIAFRRLLTIETSLPIAYYLRALAYGLGQLIVGKRASSASGTSKN